MACVGYNAASRAHAVRGKHGGAAEAEKEKPDLATIITYLTVVSLVLGIIGFFIKDLPGVIKPDTSSLSEQNVLATMVALQNDKNNAELQLTSIALDAQRSANQQTQQANDALRDSIQATLDSVRADQDAFVATRNAIAASSATANAEDANATATADAINTAAAQAVFDTTATAAFIAQITPTPTPAPTATPLPTPAPSPAPATDFRQLDSAGAVIDQNGRIDLTLRTAQAIPNPPPDGLVYVWSLDTDRDPTTGLPLHDIGVDKRVTIRFENDVWVGTVRSVAADGTLGDPFYFLDIKVAGPNVDIVLSPTDVGVPGSFDWVVRAELGGQTYSFLPADGHYSLVP